MKGLIWIILVYALHSCNSPQEIVVPERSAIGIIENCQDLGEGWSVPKDQVIGGGVGKDGIPVIESPQFIPVSSVDLIEEEIIVGLQVDGEYIGFPHRILEKHEVVNSFFNNNSFSVTYCPLTSTSVTWPRDEDNTFGVSGLLHNSNLITYDRKTDTHWAQIYSRGIYGQSICGDLDNLTTIEISWRAWKERFPNSMILSSETGFNFNYLDPPASLNQPVDIVPLFPVHNVDNRLPNYERVLLVVIDNKAKVYRLSSFAGGTSIISDFLSGSTITLIGNQDDNFIVPYVGSTGASGYLLTKDGQMADSDGNIYNLFGTATEGPNKGEKLEVPYCMMGYWFALSAFYPEVEIFQEGEF